MPVRWWYPKAAEERWLEVDWRSAEGGLGEGPGQQTCEGAHEKVEE